MRVESIVVEDIEHGRTEASDRIVAGDGGKGLVAASIVLLVTRGDISKRVGVGGVGRVEEGVDPSHVGHVGGATVIVENGNHSSEGGSSSAGTSNGHTEATAEDLELGGDSSDIREGATRGIIERGDRALEGRLREVRLDNGVLEGRTREVIRETSRREVNIDFNAVSINVGTTEGGNVRTGRGEVSSEASAGSALLRLATNTPVSRTSDESETGHSQLLEHLADSNGIGTRDSKLQVLVGHGEDGREVGISSRSAKISDHIIEENQPRLVAVSNSAVGRPDPGGSVLRDTSQVINVQ